MTSPQKEVGADQGRALSVADVLDAAADLLSKPGAWTQRANARDANGRNASPCTADAVCFCIRGAVARARGATDQYAVWPFIHAAIGANHAANWNDAPERTQAEVVAKLREAATASRTQDTEGTGA